MTVKLLQSERLSAAHVNSSVPHPLSLATAAARQHRWFGLWSKYDQQQLAGTGGRVNGHVRNRENRRQQYRENRSAHVATIGALMTRRLHSAIVPSVDCVVTINAILMLLRYLKDCMCIIRAYSVVDSSRVSTFIVSILLVVYGSFRQVIGSC